MALCSEEEYVPYYCKDFDVHYLKSIRNITDRIKAAYGHSKLCSEIACPALRTRKKHHMLNLNSSGPGCCSSSKRSALPISIKSQRSKDTSSQCSKYSRPKDSYINPTKCSKSHHSFLKATSFSASTRLNTESRTSTKCGTKKHNNNDSKDRTCVFQSKTLTISGSSDTFVQSPMKTNIHNFKDSQTNAAESGSSTKCGSNKILRHYSIVPEDHNYNAPKGRKTCRAHKTSTICRTSNRFSQRSIETNTDINNNLKHSNTCATQSKKLAKCETRLIFVQSSVDTSIHNYNKIITKVNQKKISLKRGANDVNSQCLIKTEKQNDNNCTDSKTFTIESKSTTEYESKNMFSQCSIETKTNHCNEHNNSKPRVTQSNLSTKCKRNDSVYNSCIKTTQTAMQSKISTLGKTNKNVIQCLIEDKPHNSILTQNKTSTKCETNVIFVQSSIETNTHDYNEYIDSKTSSSSVNEISNDDIIIHLENNNIGGHGSQDSKNVNFSSSQYINTVAKHKVPTSLNANFYAKKIIRASYSDGNIENFNKIKACTSKHFMEKPKLSNSIKNILHKEIYHWLNELPIYGIIKKYKQVNDNVINNLLESSNSYLSKNKSVEIAANVMNLQRDTIPYTFSDQSLSIFQSTTKFHLIYPCVSTPKQKRAKNEQKLSCGEIQYTEDIANLVRAWMNTLPKELNCPDEIGYRETMVYDLAGELADLEKLNQLAPFDPNDKEKFVKYITHKWILKLDVVDLEDVEAQSDIFIKSLKDIPVPVLTKPHCGNRQEMENIKHNENDGYKNYFEPKGIDILEDEISIWINENSYVFSLDEDAANEKIHELGKLIQPKLANKAPEEVISNDIIKWLDNIIRPCKRSEINVLKTSLALRILKVPQDETIEAKVQAKKTERAELIEEKKNPKPITITKTDDDNLLVEITMKDFIDKFIEHRFEIDDPIARGAFNHLLKRELQRLNLPTRKEVYTNLTLTDRLLPINKLYRESELIKLISDWLKNIPVEEDYNRLGNRDRIDFIIDLAKTISEIEEERDNDPNVMDFDVYVSSIINQYLVILPIKQEYKNRENNDFLSNQLTAKIKSNREQIAKLIAESSMNTTGINTDNIGDFLEEFIRINGSLIANDEVKMEAWSVRLLREIKILVQESSDPSTISKAQVYNKIANVPIPGDESVRIFDLELIYIEKITEWIKNLPLLSLSDEEKDGLMTNICDLAVKLTEKNNGKANDKEISEYIEKWILNLPIDKNKQLDIPVLIRQLFHRVYNTICKEPLIHDNQEKKPLKSSCQCKMAKNPTSVVDAIETWSNSLPIKDENANAIKKDITNKIYKEIIKINTDPTIYNDNFLYQELLENVIDNIIDAIPPNNDLQNTRNMLRNDLICMLMSAKHTIKEISAGENYKLCLEHTISASLPNPVTNRVIYDPAFEIYKSRLADMFILENFDHSNDLVKAKYERRIRDEIDKYFDSAQNQNAVKLSNEEIYNELYGALFQVVIPNYNSVVEEVEEIKTRLVIDGWFEELPVSETDNLIKLLELDQILAALAKRVHELEKQPKDDKTLRKEIIKTLNKLPLMLNDSKEVEKYAEKLKNELKSTVEQRKCVTRKNVKDKKGKKKKQTKSCSTTTRPNLDESQMPGPSCDGQDYKIIIEDINAKKKSGVVIQEIVEDWVKKIPIYAMTAEEHNETQVMRNNMIRKIMLKISEVNANPQIFNDNNLYNDLLSQEIDKILLEVPTCCDFDKEKDAKKLQLIEDVSTVKPLIVEEKTRLNYEENLDKTVERVLEKPNNWSKCNETEFKAIKEEIIENFIQFHYDKDDFESRQTYKVKIHDAVGKFQKNVKGDKSTDPLIKQNQLINELSKIPIANDFLKVEVQEIRMKNEISEFFNEIKVSKSCCINLNQIKNSLAKKLVEIETEGHNIENDIKINKEISKSLKKLDKEIKTEIIDSFVNKIKCNETERKSRIVKSVSDKSKASVIIDSKQNKKDVEARLEESNEELDSVNDDECPCIKRICSKWPLCMTPVGLLCPGIQQLYFRRIPRCFNI